MFVANVAMDDDDLMEGTWSEEDSDWVGSTVLIPSGPAHDRWAELFGEFTARSADGRQSQGVLILNLAEIQVTLPTRAIRPGGRATPASSRA